MADKPDSKNAGANEPGRSAEDSQRLMEQYIVDEATDAVLRVHLDKFEGPLEVLLYLIRAQELDIFDIPIVRITDQYLKFLELLREGDLDVAGEYLVMAATLIHIKSKMLLPVEMDEEDEELEEEDPRMELVEKLIAYRQYREVAQRLAFLEGQRVSWFTRNVKPQVDAAPDEDEEYIDASLFDLAQAFKSMLRFIPEINTETIEAEAISIDERVEHIQNLLESQQSVSWSELFAGCRSRMEVVCTFLAILELCRMRELRAQQHATFGDIRLFRSLSECNAA